MLYNALYLYLLDELLWFFWRYIYCFNNFTGVVVVVIYLDWLDNYNNQT